MELIFNKSGNGSEELKECLGFINADFRYENLVTDLTHATYDIVNIIGTTTYNAIQTKYATGLAEDATPEQTTAYNKYANLFKLLQQPIASFALLAYEGNNDITHDGNGRFSNVGTDQKMPFEWMLQRDESLQRKRAYKSIDILLNALDASEITEWLDSDEYKETKSLFINTIKDFSKIIKTFNSYHLLLRLQSFMADAEKYCIKPIIGIDRFSTLKEAIASNNQTPAANKDLLALVQIPIAYKALYDAYQVLPIEMFADTIDGYQTKPNTDEVSKERVSAFLLQKHKEHLKNLSDYIAKEDTGSSYEDPMPKNDPSNKYFTI